MRMRPLKPARTVDPNVTTFPCAHLFDPTFGLTFGLVPYNRVRVDIAEGVNAQIGGFHGSECSAALYGIFPTHLIYAE